MNVQTRFFSSEKAGEQNRNRQTNNRNKQTTALVCSGQKKEKTYHIPLYKDLKEFNRDPTAWQV